MQTLRTPAVENALRLALDGLETQLDETETAYADAQWRRHFGRANGRELERLEALRSDLLLDDRMRAVLQHWEERPRDPQLARRVALLLRRFRWADIESQPDVYQLRNRIDRAILSFRLPAIGPSASRVNRSDILRRHPDRQRRRAAWLAMAPLAEQIEANVRTLMRLRQHLAQLQGYDGFVSWALATNGLDRSWLEQFLDTLRNRTENAYQTWVTEAAQRVAAADGLRPWDLAYAAEQGITLPMEALPREGALPALKAVATSLGLGEAVGGVQVDVADIPHAALCYSVRPPDDVRILLSPRDGQAHYDVLFHEFGHALHWRSLRPPSPVFRWESPPFNEGMACFWERLSSEPEWLIAWDNLPPHRAAAFRAGWAERKIFRLRFRMAQAGFEYLAYDRLDEDLSALYQKIFGEYLKVPFDETPGWADSPFWTSHPVYFQNYVIGEAIASQTFAALQSRFGRLIDNAQVGNWLRAHYYQPGASPPWKERIREATGEELHADALLADLGCE